jgi:hypothetical protein
MKLDNRTAYHTLKRKINMDVSSVTMNDVEAAMQYLKNLSTQRKGAHIVAAAINGQTRENPVFEQQALFVHSRKGLIE